MRYKKYKMSKCEDCGEDTLDEFGHCVDCCECKECLKALEEAQVLKDSMDPTSEYWLPPRCQNCFHECEDCMSRELVAQRYGCLPVEWQKKWKEMKPEAESSMEMTLLAEIEKLQQLCDIKINELLEGFTLVQKTKCERLAFLARARGQDNSTIQLLSDNC